MMAQERAQYAQPDHALEENMRQCMEVALYPDPEAAAVYAHVHRAAGATMSREEITAFLGSLKKLRDGLDDFNCQLAAIDGGCASLARVRRDHVTVPSRP
jgi:hypothetical protein